MNPAEPIAVVLRTKDAERAARRAEELERRRRLSGYAWEAMLLEDGETWEVVAFPADDHLEVTQPDGTTWAFARAGEGATLPETEEEK